MKKKLSFDLCGQQMSESSDTKGCPDSLDETSVDKPKEGEPNLFTQIGIISINQPITKATLEIPMKTLWMANFDTTFNGDIQILINSPGGDMDAGWAFIDTMSAMRFPIRTVALGQVSSMAAMIFIAGDERIMAPNSLAMLHHFSRVSFGNYPELVATRKAEDLMTKKIVDHLVKHSKYRTHKQIFDKLLKDQDYYLSPQEMLSHGLCEHVISDKPKIKRKKI